MARVRQAGAKNTRDAWYDNGIVTIFIRSRFHFRHFPALAFRTNDLVRRVMAGKPVARECFGQP